VQPAGGGGSPHARDASLPDAAASDATAPDAAADASPIGPPVPGAVLGPDVKAGESSGVKYFTPYPDGRGEFTDIASDASGNAWFTGQYSIGRLTPDGVLTQFPLPSVVGVYIVRGPDGNMWFNTQSGLGRITPSGDVKLFANSVAPSTFYEVVLGGEGNLWFTEPDTGKLAKSTTAGAITEYDAGVALLLPHLPLRDTLAVAANGDAWFTGGRTDGGAPWTGKRIAADGTVRTYATEPYASVAVDDAGGAWFTEAVAGATSELVVARIDAGGAVKRFRVGCPATTTSTAQDDHGVVATGVGHDVWLTQARTGAIVRVDPTTSSATCFHAFGGTYTYGFAGYPERLAPAPNGSVWFTEAFYPSGSGGFPGGGPFVRTLVIGLLTP
jgi:streptogramin lyase